MHRFTKRLSFLTRAVPTGVSSGHWPRVGWWAALACVAPGCNALDEEADVVTKIVPTDERAAAVPETSSPPISGGTLMVTADGKFAVASDPLRDSLSVVSLGADHAVRTIELSPGDEPGRLIEGGNGRVHVALRRGGGVASIDPASGEILMQRDACVAPRGLAYDAESQELHVACAEGRLVTFAEPSGAPTRSLELTEDLRDVIVAPNGVWVTRFKSAEILSVSDEGVVAPLAAPPTVTEFSFETGEPSTAAPRVAWKAASAGTGSVAVLHQRHRIEEIEVDHDEAIDDGLDQGTYGASPDTPALLRCGGVTQPAVTVLDASGYASTTPSISGATLAVDMAFGPSEIALVDAGQRDPETPETVRVSRFSGESEGFFGGGFDEPTGVFVLARANILSAGEPGSVPDAGGCVSPIPVATITRAQFTAVAFTPDGRLLAQAREPALLAFFARDPNSSSGWTPTSEVTLFTDSREADTGHDIFHRDAGQGIACANCHPEGGDDGHVWSFSDTGARRTQSLFVNLRETLPLHWAGDMDDVGTIMGEVFVERMGGVHESADRLAALEGWLDSVSGPGAITADTDEAVLRGRDLFTDNHSYDVGTGETVQVPSLRSIGYRAPFMRNGCATTLHDRFTPSCGGGDLHGHTSQLGPLEIDDLVAYLKSL
jgi:hypothetical protein